MDKKVSKNLIISIWKEQYPWFLVRDSGDNRKMIGTIRKSQEEKLKLMPLNVTLNVLKKLFLKLFLKV